MRSALPDAPWATLVDSLGYTVGFLVVIMGRQALFTESTLTAVLPILVRRDRKTLVATLRFWAVVLSCNLIGTYLFAALVSAPGVFSLPVRESLVAIGVEAVGGAFWPTLVKALLAGWIIALMVWLLPQRPYGEAVHRDLFDLHRRHRTFFAHHRGLRGQRLRVIHRQCLGQTISSWVLLPTLIGNTLGGVAMVALLNHAPLAVEIGRVGGAYRVGRLPR